MAASKKGATKKAAKKAAQRQPAKTRIVRDEVAAIRVAERASEFGQDLSALDWNLSETLIEERVVAYRKALIALAGGTEASLDVFPTGRTPEEYRAAAGHYFGIMVLFSSETPKLNMRAEMKRYMAALREIQKKLPKGKRTPAEEVTAAIELLDRGYEYPAIYPLIHGDKLVKMSRPERVKFKRDFRNNVRSTRKQRIVRAQKKGGNTTQK